ncbi:Qat anti-phage system TatD family nuclease QatD [Aureimonas psammosilenae]|uniref:Qat anti-phage system TatD family nuclease QatD n=1 Tax=Aureimonas psammosilenae TaxID=2495496 RepID=UPI0012608EA4|nr:Qat anti-phage system TatD family nuclease QatD [Aureimonas psammosilenae]
MIDLHCHLDLYPDPSGMVAECITRRLYVLSVTTVPSAFEGTAALAPDGSRIKTALGLHPELAAARARELPLFERLLPRTDYVGEIGLDGSREHRDTMDAQLGVLRDILRMCSLAGGRVMSMHSRGAIDCVLDALEAEPSAGRPILHWFVGTKRQVERAAEMGCWFSVGPSVLLGERGRTAVRAMPWDRVLTESDGPFGQYQGQPTKPWDAWATVEGLAQLWNASREEVQSRLVSNFRKIVAEK